MYWKYASISALVIFTLSASAMGQNLRSRVEISYELKDGSNSEGKVRGLFLGSNSSRLLINLDTGNPKAPLAFDIESDFALVPLSVGTNYYLDAKRLEALVRGYEATKVLWGQLERQTKHFSKLDLRRVAIYTASRFLAQVIPGSIQKNSQLGEAEAALAEARLSLDGVGELNEERLQGYRRFYLRSDVTGKSHKLELLVGRPLPPSPLHRGYGVVYYLGDHEFTLSDLGRSNEAWHDGFILVRPAFENSSTTFNTRNRGVFEEVRLAIEGSLPVDKTRVYLVSPSHRMAAMQYLAYDPSQYAAVCVYQYGGFHLPTNAVEVPAGFKLPPMNILVVTNKAIPEGEPDGLKPFSFGNTRAYLSGLGRLTVSNVGISLGEAPAPKVLRVSLPYFSTHSLFPILPPSFSFGFAGHAAGGVYVRAVGKGVTKGGCSVTVKIGVDTLDLVQTNAQSIVVDFTYPHFRERTKPLLIRMNGETVFYGETKNIFQIILRGDGKSYSTR